MMRNAWIVLLLAAAAAGAQEAAEPPGPTYVIPIEGQIDRSLVVFLRRGIEQARKAKAETIVLAIDTFGGTVDPALQITTFPASQPPIGTLAYVTASPAGTGVS